MRKIAKEIITNSQEDTFSHRVLNITLISGKLLLITWICGYGICSLAFYYPRIILIICIFFAIFIIIYYNKYQSEKVKAERYARDIEESYQQRLYYMENLKQLINKVRSKRGSVEDYHNIIKISYPILGAMLNYKLSAIRDEGIELRLNVKIPEGLKLDEFELSIILGNLLDNAVQSCHKIEDRNRCLDLSIRYKQEYLVIIVENPVIETQAYSDEQVSYCDKENYRLSLSNIEYLLNKHNGIFKIVEEENVFKVKIALLMDSPLTGNIILC